MKNNLQVFIINSRIMIFANKWQSFFLNISLNFSKKDFKLIQILILKVVKYLTNNKNFNLIFDIFSILLWIKQNQIFE